MKPKNQQENTENLRLAEAQENEQKPRRKIRNRKIALATLAGISIITFGAYSAYRNDKRARVLYGRFIKAADTDGDGYVSLADQERYLSEHGIELNSITLPDGTKVVRNISVFEADYCSWVPSVKRKLDDLEKRLFGEVLK